MMRTFLNLFGVGHATLIDDDGEVQKLQLTERAAGSGFKDRVTDKVRRVMEFGFTSVPPIDSEVLVIGLLSDRSGRVAIATSHRPSRIKGLKPGDVALYDVRGARIVLTEDGLQIDCAGLAASIENCTTLTIKASEKVRIEADTLEVTGDVVSRADGTNVSLNGLRDAYHAHKHTGVQTGSGSTGLTDHDV